MSSEVRMSLVGLNERSSQSALPRASQSAASLVALAMAIGLSGCSADVTRFDPPSLSLSDEKPGVPPASPRSGYNDPSAAQPRAGLSGVGADGLPPPQRTASLPPPSGYSSQPLPPPQVERRLPPPTQRATPSGETVEVHQGDTLYGLAKRHSVPVSALIDVNGLSNNATIKPGQKLVLPAVAQGSSDLAPGRPAVPRFTVARAPAVAPEPTPGWDATHTMKAGESLYGIARQHKVTLAELQRANGITEPTRVRAGAVLKVPGEAGVARAEAPSRSSYPPLAGASDAPASPNSASPVGVRVINQPQRSAALSDPTNDAQPLAPPPAAAEPGTASGARFSWPARGKVIAGFGKRADGTHNDGVNLSVPVGTDIHAAEGGRVAYAGGDIQAYGNLVLIRHDNGWVSAYAHADKILVQRDEVVRRGQVIAKSGRTGTVDQPQVHFELRQGAKPIDPLPHMER